MDGADALARGAEALAQGRWQEARGVSDSVVESATDPATRARAAEGLSDAAWWLGDVAEALRARRAAYESWREAGNAAAAARVALWLSREYFGAFGNKPAAQGWVRRAATLAGDTPPVELAGDIALAGAALQTDPSAQVAGAEAALSLARQGNDGDLEARALARLGLGHVMAGRLDEALGCFNEAMAIGTGGETSLQTLGYLCCDLSYAGEVWGDLAPFNQWFGVVQRLAFEHGHPPLVAFCATCCAEVFSTGGDWPGAEAELRRALASLKETGHHARCVPPMARLGELLLAQGRLEEAEDLLAADRSEEALAVRGRLALVQGRAAAAVTLLERVRRRAGGDSLATVGTMTLLVDAYLATSRTEDAERVTATLEALGTRSGNPRVVGRAALARARVHTAAGHTSAAVGSAEDALDQLIAAAPGAVEVAEAHLLLARLRATDAPDVAVSDARAAVDAFERAGATARADQAAAIARELGDHSRVGAKGLGTLTRREQEVLRLLAQGLTNSELAERLFISPKTAENHVGNILSKLNLRSRTEAAAYAHAHQG